MTNASIENGASVDNHHIINGQDNTKRRLTKNEKRRLREKVKDHSQSSYNNASNPSAVIDDENIVIEYISPQINLDEELSDAQVLNDFKSIFQKFMKVEDLVSASSTDAKLSTDQFKEEDHQQNVTSTNPPETQKLSKKKLKLASRLSVAELKQLVSRPDVVEAHDVTSSDPRLLVMLKAMRNTVPVPRHWCAKRKYLQGKRGIEKVPFQLPEFIAETGIAKIRESVIEQENLRKSKQKARERMQPKMGRIDIDYQVLHDAFFKYQTKPKLTIHGDLYYEGKEFEVHVKDSKPGFLSTQLREALGMTEHSPPPYLINMQRHGPPPSYPSLKIPGLNAPLPPGAIYGYQAGGWGKPPVDEYGRPIYGDVFGVLKSSDDMYNEANVDKKSRWGELIITQQEEEEENEESEDEQEEDDQPQHKKAKTQVSGTDTPMTLDGMSSVATGLETPGIIDLRKRSGTETPNSMYTDVQPRDLYKVIPQKDISHGSHNNQLFDSERAYSFSENIEDDKSKEAETSNQEQNGKKKRRLDSSASVQKLKDFKF